MQDPASNTVVVHSDSSGLIDRIRLTLSGDYEVETELARGGMAVVYKAREIGLGRMVALKVLSPELAAHMRAAERFKREARVVAELDHPNIVPVYRVGQIGDVLFIAMKFIEGRPLGQIVEAQGALPVPVVIHVLRSAARALEYAHERQIVHRDVKGDNILVDGEGRALMTDFGVALRAADVTLTTDGSVIGTPAFMSPEQCAGKRAGPQSDQYALGVVAFSMLAGAAPFASETLAGYIQHHLATPAPDLRQVRDDIPEPLVRVVSRALAKAPGDRFATTRAMREALEAIPLSPEQETEARETLRRLAQGAELARVSAHFVPPVAGARTLVMPRERRRRRRVAIAAAAGAALAASAVLWARARQAVPPATVGNRPDSVSLTLLGQTVADREGMAAAPAATALERAAPSALPAATGRLRISVVPGGAEILVDGHRAGQGGWFDYRLPAGRRRIRAAAPGYLPWDTVVNVAQDSLHNLGRVTLRPREDGW
jgi:tRNA A-37 threonylcarbamoyl transferase component Bud32